MEFWLLFSLQKSVECFNESIGIHLLVLPPQMSLPFHLLWIRLIWRGGRQGLGFLVCVVHLEGSIKTTTLVSYWNLCPSQPLTWSSEKEKARLEGCGSLSSLSFRAASITCFPRRIWHCIRLLWWSVLRNTKCKKRQGVSSVVYLPDNVGSKCNSTLPPCRLDLLALLCQISNLKMNWSQGRYLFTSCGGSSMQWEQCLSPHSLFILYLPINNIPRPGWLSHLESGGPRTVVFIKTHRHNH